MVSEIYFEFQQRFQSNIDIFNSENITIVVAEDEKDGFF